MSAVEVFARRLKGLIVAIYKVPAVYVVYEAIAIIVNAVAGGLSRVHPGIRSQVLVLKINSCVQHHSNDVVAARGDVPRLSSIDAWHVPGITGLATQVGQPPHLIKERVAGNRFRSVDKVIGLGVFYARVFLRAAHGVFNRDASVEMDQLDPRM